MAGDGDDLSCCQADVDCLMSSSFQSLSTGGRRRTKRGSAARCSAARAGVIGINAADDGAAVGAGEPFGQDMDDPGRGQGRLWLTGQRKSAGRERINGWRI